MRISAPLKYTKHRLAVLLPSVFCAFLCFAQHPISVALQELLETGDFESANKNISQYGIGELAELPDSVLFDYYYLKAAIKDYDGNEKEKRNYLIVAKNLCEKSQGIHSPVYLELCWAIGKSLEETGDTIGAFEIYQSALIQSIGLYSLRDEDVKWQYEDIENKTIAWYKDDNLRRQMILHRNQLIPRDGGKDAVQNDMEFYLQFYKDEKIKQLISTADSLASSNKWNDAASLYLQVTDNTLHNPIAQATLYELAAQNFINSENFQQAEALLLKNIELLDSYKKSKVYRRTLSQLANLYNAIHNYTKAKDYAGQAKFWYEDALDFSRGYILCLHRCATLERGSQNYFLALLLEDVALQELYRNKVFGEISGKKESREAFLANILSSSSLHYNQFGFREDACRSIQTAIELAESNNLDASTYYSNLADIYIANREFSRAVEAVQKAYELSTSDNNKIQIGTTLCLTQLLARQKNSDNVLKKSSDNLHSFVNQVFSFASMDERRNFWSYFEYYFPLLNFLTYQTGNQNMNGLIYNNILLEKGLLLRTANKLRDQISQYGTDEDKQMYDRLLQQRRLLTNISNREAANIISEIDRLDKTLTRKFSSYADYVNSFAMTWEDIQNELDDKEIAIEFYNIPDVKWKEDYSDLDGKYRYCAVTLRKGYDAPHIIPLFTEDQLESLEKEILYETDSLYHLIWNPLEKELDGVENIYFAADRELHKIGIEYAPMPDGRIIGDKYKLYRLSSTRVLAEKADKCDIQHAVLYGGLRYDVDKDDLVAESRGGEYHSKNTSRAVGMANLRYGVNYLPGTLTEVKDIANNFGNKCQLRTDIAGTEESFKSLGGKGINLIHLATHGFFWSEEDADKRSYVNFLNKPHNDNQSFEDKALLRSGLFFSGANIGLKGEALPDEVEDGVLTALELSDMNLGKVDMVVMSACQSGLGETTGEGVFGLQRGFKLAGANTLLMSLWKVDDSATQMLMTEFYKNYLTGKSKQESLRLAQQSLRNNPEYSDAEYWAAFILLDGLN